MSESDEDILALLNPIFCEYLEIKDIIKLAKILSKKKFIIPDVVSQLDLYVDKTEKVKTLFQNLVSTSAKEWKTKLRYILELLLEQDDLSRITEAALGSNENVIWILRSWSKLSTNEDVVRILANVLEQKELPSEGWLLEFLSRIASADESVAGHVIGLLKAKVSPSLKSTAVVENSSETTKTSVDEEPLNLDDINESFLPLAPILSDCMDSKQIVTMIESLKNRKYLTEAQANVLMSENCFSTDTFKSLATHIQSNTKTSWRKDVVECIQSSAHQTIFHIAQKQLDVKDKDDDFHWMITNWAMLMHHEQSVKQTAEEKLNYRWTRSKEEFWLSNVIFEVSNSTEKRSFVDALKLEIERSQIRKSQSTVSPSEMSEGTASTVLLHQEQAKINTIKENILPLLPMLTDCLKNKDVITLAKELMLKGHLSHESMEEIKQSEESAMTLKKLVEMLTLTTKEKWQEDLVSAIQHAGKDRLKIVMEKYFFGTDEKWKWLLINWTSVMSHGELLKNAACKLMSTQCKFIPSTYQEDVLHVIIVAANTEDSVVCEALADLIEACTPVEQIRTVQETIAEEPLVHEKLQTGSDLEEPAEKKQRTNGENKISRMAPSVYANEIEELVDPLLPLLVECLQDEIHAVINHLKNGEHILEGSCTQSDSVEASFASFKKNAKDNWKQDFFDALKQCKVQGIETVFHVVAMYMDKKNLKTEWKWFVTNWNVVLQHVDVLKRLFKQDFKGAAVSAKNNWLLSFTFWTSNAPNKKIKKFIEKFRIEVDDHFHTDAEKPQKELHPSGAVTNQPMSDDKKRKLKEKNEENIKESKHPRQAERDDTSDANEAKKCHLPSADKVDTSKQLAPASDVENSVGRRSYVSVAKGATSETKSQGKHPVGKLSEKPATVLTYDHYCNPRSHCKEGEYMLEFQALILDEVHENDSVCVYMNDDDMLYPMHWNRRGIYTLLLPTSKRSQIYKYCIIRNEKSYWEHLPATSYFHMAAIRNRQRTFSSDQLHSGHVIAFDVVTEKTLDHNIYLEIYERNLLRLLPSFQNVSLKKENGEDIPYFAFLKMYLEWLTSMKSGLTVLVNYVPATIFPKIKNEDLWHFMRNEVERLAHNPAKRVLAALAFCIALDVHRIYFESPSQKNAMCYALSMHNIDDEEQCLIIDEIHKFIDKSKSNHLLDTRTRLRRILAHVSSIPECLLLLPLLKLLENAKMDDCTKSMEKPALPIDLNWMHMKVQLRRDATHQDHLVEMSEPISLLIKSFPWIREMYQEVLSLETTAKLLRSGDSFYQLFDIGGILNKLFHFWIELAKKSGSNDEKILSSLFTYLYKTIMEKSTFMKEALENSEQLVKESICFLEQSSKILAKMTSYMERHTFVPVENIKKSLTVVSCILEMSRKIQQNGGNDCMSDALDTVQTYLLETFLKTIFVTHRFDELDRIEVELWNFLITFNWSMPFKKKWDDQCQNNMLAVLPRKFSGNAERLLDFFTEKFETMDPHEKIIACFTDIVTEHVEESLLADKSSSYRLLRFGKPKMRKICVKLMIKQWKQVQQSFEKADSASAKHVFRFIFEWKPAVSLIKVLSSKGVNADKETATILQRIEETARSTVFDFIHGKILEGNLKKVAQNRKTFVDVYELLCKGDGDSVDGLGLTSQKLQQIIEFRLAELEVFYKVRRAVEDFRDSIDLFEDTIKVNMGDLVEKAEAFVSHKMLCDLVDCLPINVTKLVPMKADPIIPYFKLTKEEIKELLLMFRSKALTQSYVQEQVKAKALEVARKLGISETQESLTISLQQFFQDVWFPVKGELLQIADSIDKGNILFSDVETVFKTSLVDKDKGNAGIKQMVTMFYELYPEPSHAKIPELRITQLQDYKTLKMNQEIYKAIQKIRLQLKLKGKFALLDKALSLEEGGKTTLASVKRDVVKASQLFKGIAIKNCNILVDFIRHQNLIDWLKENMKNIGEVKVMSDLALISAGETPMEVDRVSCFLSAVMGFSPLLFDLGPASGWEEFHDACKEVWSNVGRDPQLPDKWRDTANQLEWLKATKDFHGSVEHSSLTRAKLINESGMYVVGGKDSTMPSLEESLSMEITKQLPEYKTERVKMTLPELRDLQSRLMLIAGEAEKGRQDVNRFIDVLSAVEKLAKTYIKLKRSGCMLFTKWKATIKCRDTDGNVTVSVYFDKKTPAVSSGEKVIEEVQKLTTVLEEALTEWKSYLNEKRSYHYHLNHFNIHQLTYLCKNLANSDGIDGFPDQVYCLLKCLVDDPSYETVVDALDLATRIADTEEQEEVEQDVGAESNIEKKKKIVRSLVQSELAENVAKAAVQATRSLDPDDCYLWALENEFDVDRVTQLQKDFDAEMGFAAHGNKIEVVRDVINDRLNLTLVEVIERIQVSLENDSGGSIGNVVKTVCERYFKGTAVTSLNDCVSLEHLGEFLTILCRLSKGQTYPNRQWGDVFICGQPNLIICAPDIVWRTILSIYTTSSEQPLPSTTEVLICSEDTTGEDVELLLRRAITTAPDKGERIYCLACADQLSFTVAQEVELMFLQLVQMPMRNESYRLIILASSQHHYITSIFDEYQITNKMIPKEQDLRSYIAKHLEVAKDIEGSVAQVDKSRSCVRLVCSEAAGMGKSLYIQRRCEEIQKKFDGSVFWHSTVLRFLDKSINVSDVIATLYEPDGEETQNEEAHFIHVDITPSVEIGAYKFLFNLIILGSIQNEHGFIWRRCPEHFYAIEYTIPTNKGVTSFTNLLELLPSVTCLSPSDVRDILQQNHPPSDTEDKILMDFKMLQNPVYQRPFQYLFRYKNNVNLDNFSYKKPEKTALNCLETLLQFCHVRNPSWSALCHFSSFLNVQLRDCENSIFCNFEIVGEDSCLLGFKQFVVKFMIQMSQDFATPSLSGNDHATDAGKNLYELHQLRRRWESGFHPYLFFNDDDGGGEEGLRTTMSFVHFNISKQGHLCHPVSNDIVQRSVMDEKLYDGLLLQRVTLQQNFDELSREKKLQTLCAVFGVQDVFDPDPSYELTTDNVLKMLAIHMRFRCDIPVIIMGETGCGKTRMVEFMSRLKAGKDTKQKNMVVVKVHGGVTVSMVQERVRKAVELAKENGNLETILFLDEANTTEAIYAIKEVMCDGTVHGKPFHNSGLKIVAACNPYKKHSEDVIQAMEKSGLGFNVKAAEVKDKFAGIAMRYLVYRVIPLPPSMQPLVWDFGQLNNDTEKIYIRQMVLKLKDDIRKLPVTNRGKVPQFPDDMVDVMTTVLAKSQCYMRERRGICSFVSLRDVERTILSFKWFYQQRSWLDQKIDDEKVSLSRSRKNFGYAIRALIQSIGMCYHATLEDRRDYRVEVAASLGKFNITQQEILHEIIACQNVFIKSIELEKDIARNEALRENVFMMIVCAEMRTPLFLVGKPGSSKSLAKTIVTDAMQGRNSRSHLFQNLKQIQVLSFQCSAVSDAVGIETIFTQCAQLQKKQELDKYVAVVVLDEIGLAEDSPKMPLKVLHPLLEVGSTTHSSFEVQPHNKVGFVGISNWALDPAKMNRGIFVTRGEPSENDLQKTAEAIFRAEKNKIENGARTIKAVTAAYLQICKDQEREFFGLRDYYGLLKMIYRLISSDQAVEFYDIAVAILRNFSGGSTDTFKVFQKHLEGSYNFTYRPNISVVNLVKQNLQQPESRFLLLLTKQYSAVSLLSKVMGGIDDFQVIFGSSFPRDNDYTEVCRNINKIKVCMESGKAVVLLNLRDLYESLYDALNQHYVTFAGQRYVDLGLGGHRVKCRIAENFRLIVIEEGEIVYKEFPIPLINRLEKHVFEMNSVLTENQSNTVNRLKEWVYLFADVPGRQQQSFTIVDCFAGYQDDTSASAILSVASAEATESFERAKHILLETASLDAVARLGKSKLGKEFEKLQQLYNCDQAHGTLNELLLSVMNSSDFENRISVHEVTSFSVCLNEQDRIKLETLLKLPKNRVKLLTLQQLQTEEEYNDILNEFFTFACSEDRDQDEFCVLLIQCPQAQQHTNLIACAKYCAINKVKEIKTAGCKAKVILTFVFTLERSTKQKPGSFKSFHSGECRSVYVDELRPDKHHIAPIPVLWNLKVSEILQRGCEHSGEKMNQQVVDVQHLIQICIPEAMARLTNQVANLSRNRVKIMMSLCKELLFSEHFRNNIMAHVVRILEDCETVVHESWIVEEACSHTALQEGGSFLNTLWLRLKHLVGLALAKVISIADIDQNLDLICKATQETAHIANLWFAYFNSRMCEATWNEVSRGNDFTVKTQPGHDCLFPFSRLLIDELCKNWAMADHLAVLNKEDGFVQKIENSWISPLLSQAMDCNGGQQQDVIKRFTNDLVKVLYKPLSNNGNQEVEAIMDSILILFKAKRENQKDVIHNALLELFMVLMQLQPDLQLLGEIMASCTEIFKFCPQWLNEQRRSPTFVLPVYAFQSVLQYLEEEAANLGKLESCLKWKELVCRMKRVADPVLAKHANTCPNVTTLWKQIKFVELFLDQLVVRSSLNVENYIKTLAPLARRLWKGASKVPDLADVQFLNIITKTLQGCTKDIYLKLLCSWNDTRCRVCKVDKFNEPVLLPCGHYLCSNCVTQGGDNTCPLCRKPIPNINDLKPLELSKDQKKEYELFKSSTTSFLLEYLSTFCFPSPESASQENDLEPPNDKILFALEKLVICDNQTHRISPFHSSFDVNPTARSYILQLLLRCDRKLVKDQLDHHFDSMTAVLEDKEMLMDIYLQCSHDMLVNRLHAGDNADVVSTAFVEQVLFRCLDTLKREKTFSQMDHLEICSQLQYVASITAQCIHLLHTKDAVTPKQKRAIKPFIERLCAECNVPKLVEMKQYLVKCLCRRHGTDSFDILLQEETYRKNLVPQNLIPQEDAEDENFYLHSDAFVLSGESYIKTKDLLFEVTQKEDVEELVRRLIHEIQQSQDSVFQIMLAVSVWAARGIAGRELREEVVGRINQRLQMHLTGRVHQPLFKDIATKELDVFKNKKHSRRMQYKLTELITMAGLVFLGCGEGVLTSLRDFITNPQSLVKSFIPTMPASNFFEVREVMQLERSHHTSPKAYKCPNGHVYFIGECTNPVQAGVCPDCGKKIGGQQYGLLHQGNTAGEVTEESQTGYLLEPPEKRLNATPERNMTKLSVCATRICLHAAMLLGSRNGNAIKMMVKGVANKRNTHEFLLAQLTKDLEQVAQCSGKSVDDAILLMHHILHSMRKYKAQGNIKFGLQSMNARKEWEIEFQRQFLSLVFKNTEMVINQAQQVINDAGKGAVRPLQRLVYELSLKKKLPQGMVKWNCANLWKYRTHVDVQHLKLRLEAVDEKTAGDGAVLKVLLNLEHVNLIPRLTTILTVQSAFIAKYRQKVDISDTDKLVLQDFVAESGDQWEEELRLYIDVWNKVRKTLPGFDRYNTLRRHFDEPMTLNSPISMCLPCDRGRGCCALVLAEYLIEKQNTLLNKSRELITPNPTFEQVDASNLTVNQLVCINENRDLLPLILANSQYEATMTEAGPQHSITYNLGLLERKVEENFILRKCIVKKETISRMTYPQDVGLGKDSQTVKDKYPQDPLSPRMCQAVDAVVANARTADICEAVRTITLIIQFLAKLGGEMEQTICDYAEKDLLLPTDETAMIPRAAKVCHCLALYERLSWHRSLRSIANGQNPFELVSTNTDKEMTKPLLDQLTPVFQQINVEELQFELNSLMLVGPELQEDWSLSDALLYYMESKYDEKKCTWCRKLPAEILVKHAQHVFTASMKLKAS